MDEKTSLGLSKNLEALFAYALFWVSGFIFLIIEKDNRYVRFHAMQSFATFVLFSVILILLGIVPFIGGMLSNIVRIIWFVLWILLMLKAYKGEMFKVPVIGDIVEKQMNK